MSETPVSQAPTVDEQVQTAANKIYESPNRVDEHFAAWENEVSPKSHETYDATIRLEDDYRPDLNYLSDVEPKVVTHESVVQPSLEDEKEKIFRQAEAMTAEQMIQYVASHTTYIAAIRTQTLSRDDFVRAA